MAYTVEEVKLPSQCVKTDGVDKGIEGRAPAHKKLEDGDTLRAMDEGEDFGNIDKEKWLHDIIRRIEHEDHCHHTHSRSMTPTHGIGGAETSYRGENHCHQTKRSKILNPTAQYAW